eukprot:474773_1
MERAEPLSPTSFGPARCSTSQADQASASGWSPTPLPKAKMAIVCIIQLSEAVLLTQVIPFLPFFVQRLMDTNSEDPSLATNTGLLAASFSYAQFVSSYFWGSISDRIGRRPVIMIGLLGNVILIPLFGFATTLLWAFVFRSLAGIVNGNIGVMKTYLKECLDDTNQAKGFSFIGLNYSIGLIIGPLVGGSLYDLSWPSVFEGFPAALPCIVCASMSVVALLISIFKLDETLNRSRRPGASATSYTPLLSEAGGSHSVAIASISARVELGSVLDRESDSVHQSEWSVIKELCQNGPFVRSTALYALFGLVFIVYEQTLTLWAKVDPEHDGWGWPVALLGYIMASGGVSIFISQAFLFHRLADRFGIVTVFERAGLIPPVCFVSFIAMRYSTVRVDQIVMMVFVQNLSTIAAAMLFTVSVMLVSMTVEPEVLGSANGLAQSITCLMRGIGPTVSGFVFGWSLEREMDKAWGWQVPVLNRNLCFVVCAILTLYLVYLSRGIPRKYNCVRRSH